MATPGPAIQDDGQQRKRVRQKRVQHACDYCRQKRLKCTADRRPCLNCELYNVECITTDKHRRIDPGAHRRASTAASPGPPPPATGPSPGTSHHVAVSPVPPSASPSSAAVPGVMAAHYHDPGHLHFDMTSDVDVGFQFNCFDPVLISQPGFDGLTLGHLDQHHPEPASHIPPAQPSHPISPASISEISTISGKVSSLDRFTEALKPRIPDDDKTPSFLPGVFVRNQAGSTHYLGSNSTAATLALCIQDALKSHNTTTAPDALQFMAQCSPHMGELDISYNQGTGPGELPPKEEAMAAVTAYYDYVNTLYPIMGDEFRTQSELFYTDPHLGFGPLDYARFYLVVSLGLIWRGRESYDDSEARRLMSHNLYQKATTLVHAAFATPNLSAAQMLLLHVIYNSYQGKPGVACSFCGLAVRIAQCLGLHRRSPHDMDLTDAQITLGSYVWWTTYMFDTDLCLGNGRPPAIFDATVDRDKPSQDPNGNPTDDGDSSSSSSSPSLAQIFSWKCELVRIGNRFCHLMHQGLPVTARLAGLTKLDSSLLDWRDKLPSECRPEQIILAGPDRYKHILMLHLNYFNMMRAIHWASSMLLSPVDENEKKSELQHQSSTVISTRIRASEKLCLGAARSFVSTLNDAYPDLQKEHIFPANFQADYYIAAISILYRSLCRAPTSPSARADLEHLRAGKLHLQQDSHDALLPRPLTAAFEMMLSSAERLVLGGSGGGGGSTAAAINT